MSADYLRPASLQEALAALAQAGDKARVVAGGTDLMVELRGRRLGAEESPSLLVDVADLPELAGARLEGDDLVLGAGLTFAQCQVNPLIAARLPLLAMAARTVGSLQIRNVATLGGNVGNSSPAGDGVTVLTGLGSRARVAGPGGEREVLVEDLVAAKDLRAGEVLVNFRIPAPVQPNAAAFRKVIRRQAVGIARFNLAVQLSLSDGLISEARLGVGAVFPSPRRLREVESLLLGGEPGPTLWQRAAELTVRLMLDACGTRPSMIYKEPALFRVTAATLARAWKGGRS